MLFEAPIRALLCCTFAVVGCATTLQFHYGFLFPVLHLGHKIFPFSSFDIFLPMIISSLPHLAHSILLPPPFFLYFHASKHLLHHRFLSCFPVRNPCPQFFSVLVPLYLYPPYSTNVTTSHLVLYLSFSLAAPFEGMSHALLCSCAFLYKECAGFLSCCAYCGIATYTVKPKIYSGLKLTKFRKFAPQEAGLR